MATIHQLERVPPHNLEAEQGVLGSMLLDRDAIARTVEILRPEDFYRDAHRVIFAAMVDLFERGEPVDLITVTNRLAEGGKLEDVGGPTYLASLPNTVPTAANVDFYAGIVLEKAMLRALIGVGTRIAALGYEGADDVATLIDEAEKLVFGIASRRNVQDFQPIKEILKASFEKIDKRYQEKGTVTGLPTGFTDFDMLTSGLQPADMIIVAARPSVGKCLTGDAEIVLEDGSIITIEELYHRRTGRVLTLAHDWTLRFVDPSAFVDDGPKPTFRITTESGRQVKCTAVHPFLTPKGWLPLIALRPGDRIAIPRIVNVFGSRRLPKSEVQLLARLTADHGSSECPYVPNQPSQTTRVSPRMNDSLHEAPAPEGTLGNYLASACHISPATNAIRQSRTAKPASARITHRPSPHAIPPVVFTLAKDQLALFLKTLFASKGWIVPDGDHVSLIAYSTASERQARQVQHLLLRFGIMASLQPTLPSTRRDQAAWCLKITDPASLQTFEREIGIPRHSNRVSKAAGIPRTTLTISLYLLRSSREGASDAALPHSRARRSFPQGTGSIVDDSAVADTPGGVYWDRVVSVEPAGVHRVYDLTIPDTHNFVANDICVHNTTFATNIAQHAAIVHKVPVAIFSLETSKEQLVQRILCAEAQVDNTKLRTGFLADEDWRRLARAMGGLSEAPIYIDDSPTLSVIEMRAKARKLKAEHGLGLIVIDYIQMIQSYKRAENRTQELSEIARSIKSLAKELDVPIIAISQLSRAVESLGQKRPMLSHLRESGELEQTADLVVFLYREDYYDLERAQREGKENVCEVIIAKHRNGPIGTIELYFHKEYSRFANLERRR